MKTSIRLALPDAAEARRASISDTDRLAQALARAFDKDPVVSWLLRKDDRRAEAYDVFFHSCLTDMCLPLGEVWTDENSTGASLWYPPGSYKISLIRQAAMVPDMIRSVGLSGLVKLVYTKEILDREHPKKPHYFLQFLGVDPVLQKKGIGGSLLAPIIERCDREGCGAYLENSNEKNLDFYGRHGFRVTKKISLGRCSPVLWLMWRDSKPVR